MFTDECITKIANYRFALSIAIEIVGEKSQTNKMLFRDLRLNSVFSCWPSGTCNSKIPCLAFYRRRNIRIEVGMYALNYSSNRKVNYAVSFNNF